jgi:hypothetical protein
MLNHIALVPYKTNKVKFSEVARVSAALQQQVMRDFGPIWNVQATVDAFETLQDVPIGYWPVIIADDIHQPGAAGVHLDKHGQPFALVSTGESPWSLTASHEALEMLADPYGKRLVAGDALQVYLDQRGITGGRRLQYLVEVCDPCEAQSFSYTVNGITVSDFYTPHFFDPVTLSGVRYSFSGRLTGPRTLLPGGYISFLDPVEGSWFQATSDAQGKQGIVVLGRMEKVDHLRSEVNKLTANHFKSLQIPAGDPRLIRMTTTVKAAEARASGLQQEVDALLAA